MNLSESGIRQAVHKYLIFIYMGKALIARDLVDLESSEKCFRFSLLKGLE